ncbi:cytochrome P450 [Amycolatopsis anabasis]|uniref:cytochrome P450 n=1 Tax=Amycolatopsis anabasis TaxID=1840409 RepID=UPI00131E3E3A|nr:cytochrome P450 [Amycolatopsis anabasis]
MTPVAAGCPVVGSGPDLVRDLVGTFTRAWREHGDFVRFPLPGGRRMYLAVHPAHIQHVLEDRQPNYPKDPLSIGKFEPFVGQGLFTSNGDFHFRQRRLAQPAFSGARIGAFAPAMVDAAGDLARRWRPVARAGETLDVTGDLFRLALTVVMRTLFSTEVDAVAGKIATAVRTCNAYTNLRLQRFVELPPILPTRARRRFLAARAELDEFVYGLIARRRETGESTSDLLGRFLGATDPETGARMSDRQVRDEVVTIFLGGYETTALSLTWTLSLLSRHPEAERRVRDELAEVVGGREPRAEDLPKLKYLRMVYAEALRLYPPVWTISRTPLEDDVIGGHPVERGAQVFLSPYLVHRHPEFWVNPEGFDPERFAGGPTGGVPRYAYLPFSRGPRLCPGSSIALLEAPLVLARLLGEFRFSLAPGHRCVPTSNVFLYPEGGMPMRVEEAP